MRALTASARSRLGSNAARSTVSGTVIRKTTLILPFDSELDARLQAELDEARIAQLYGRTALRVGTDLVEAQQPSPIEFDRLLRGPSRHRVAPLGKNSPNRRIHKACWLGKSVDMPMTSPVHNGHNCAFFSQPGRK